MRLPILLAGATLLVLAGPTQAACLDEITALSPGTTSGSTVATTGSVASGRISKDGRTAPLQTTSGTGQDSSAGGSNQASSAGGSNQGSSQGHQGIAKDGSTMPLANQPGGGNTSVATSQQDVQSQQHGGQTAATAGQQNQAGTSGTHSPEMMAALDRARTLQQQGNEAGCMQAVQEAKRLQQ
jgi:hypothetical protein